MKLTAFVAPTWYGPLAALALLGATGGCRPSNRPAPPAVVEPASEPPATEPAQAAKPVESVAPPVDPVGTNARRIEDGRAWFPEFEATLSTAGDPGATMSGDGVATIKGVKLKIGEEDGEGLDGEPMKPDDFSELKAVFAGPTTKAFEGKQQADGFELAVVHDRPKLGPVARVMVLRMIRGRSITCEAHIDGVDTDRSFRVTALGICRTLAASP